MVSTPFPVISFEPFLSGTPDGRNKVALELYNAFHTYGWVYLKDFGISMQEIEEMFRRSKEYFDQPMEEKLKHKFASASVNQGYTAQGAEQSSGVSHKEAYEHRRFKNELCPAPGELNGFREFMDGFYQKCSKLSIEVLRALAMVMDIDADFFTESLKTADPQLRILHYMPVTRKTLEQEDHFRINPHCDYGLCTILFQDSVGGLEVDRFHDGHFVSATPIPGTCVINVADLLQLMSNDRLRSTRHRVVSPPLTEELKAKLGPDDLLPARYSTAFFVHPDPSTMITPIVKDGEPCKYEAVNAGDFRNMRTARNYRMEVTT